MLKAEDFIEITGYLRVLEKRMLNSADINRIAETSGIAETLRQISQNSTYDFSALTCPEDSEIVIRNALKKVYDEMRKISPDDSVVDAAAVKYEFHNIKVAIKLIHAKTDLHYLYSDIPRIPAADVEGYVFGLGKSENLPGYTEAAVDEAAKAFGQSGDVSDIDIVIDRHMFVRLLALCGEIGSPFITEYARLSIDCHNIRTLLRANNMKKGARFLDRCLIPGGLTDAEFFAGQYGKSPDDVARAFNILHLGDAVKRGVDEFARTGNYAGLEKRLDDRLVEHVKNTKFTAYGPEILFAYLLSKENEARQIRIIIACKRGGIRPEVLTERLRENYA